MCNSDDPFGLCTGANGKEVENCETVSAADGEKIYEAAVKSGKWTWTEGKTTEGQIDKDQCHNIGDCTDFVEAAMIGAGMPAIGWKTRPGTGQFEGNSNYAPVTGAPRAGDVVIYDGHAGISNGEVRNGQFRAIQNGVHGVAMMSFNKDAKIYRRKVPVSP